MKLVRRRVLAINYDKWAVKVGRTVHFELVGKCVPLEPVSVTFEEEDVQAYFFSIRMVNFTIFLYCYFLPKNTEQRLLPRRYIVSKDRTPQALLVLKNVLEGGVLLLTSSCLPLWLLRLINGA